MLQLGCRDRLLCIALLVPLIPRISYAQSNSTQQLQSLFDEEWQYELRLNPEYATALGDNRYNDRLCDGSAEAIQEEIAQARKFLARFEAIDPATLSAQDALSRELMLRELRQNIEGAKFKPWEMSVTQRSGPHIEMPDLIAITPKPMLVKVKFTNAGLEAFSFAGTRRQATHFVLHVDIGGLKIGRASCRERV